MNRIEVIQQIIKRIKARRYLEIGVSEGECFLKIKARYKTAVDPQIRIPIELRRHRLFGNLFVRFYEQPSDEFFSKNKPSHGVDVAFIDGLHTWQQALRDVENTLCILNKGGVIVMHDCNPTTPSAAQPADSLAHAASLNLPGWNGEWCGDVWKTVCYLRSQRSNLRVFVLDCDFGLAIVMRGEPERRLALAPDELEKLSYADLAQNRRDFLNLKPASYFAEFLEILPP